MTEQRLKERALPSDRCEPIEIGKCRRIARAARGAAQGHDSPRSKGAALSKDNLRRRASGPAM